MYNLYIDIKMVILSSEEFKVQENNHIHMGLEGLKKK